MSLYHSQHLIFYTNSTVLSRLTTYQFILLYYLILSCRRAYFISLFKIVTFVSFFNKFQKENDPCKNMGKNIKSYATTQVHFPREREGGLTAKVQIFCLTHGMA